MTLTHLFRLPLAAAIIAIAGLMSACTETVGEFHDPVTAAPAATKTYKAGFYLTAGELSSRSRTTPPGNYDPGDGIENFIDLENRNIRVLIYDLGDRFMTEFTELTVTPAGDYQSSKRYFISGSTTTDISSGKFKVIVLANWPAYPDSPEPSMDELFSQTFDFDGSQPSVNNPIPMYGIREINLPEIKPEQSTDLGTIHLIRALAKIEVIFEDPDENWHLSRLELTRYNTSGFCAPAVTGQDDYVKDNWNNDYIGRPFIPANVIEASNLSFTDAGNGHYVLYVPEFRNVGAGSATARICADFAESFLGERYIDLRDSSQPGSPLTDIMRNIWYRITITKLRETSSPQITVDVIPYALCDLEPVFGL